MPLILLEVWIYKDKKDFNKKSIQVTSRLYLSFSIVILVDLAFKQLKTALNYTEQT